MTKKASPTSPPKEEATSPPASPSTPTPSPYEPNDVELPGKPTKLTAVLSVQFLFPTRILGNSSQIEQVGRTQAIIIPRHDGVVFRSNDSRSRSFTFVPMSAIRAITYEGQLP